MTRWTQWILPATATAVLLSALGCSDSIAPRQNKAPVIRDIILFPEAVILGGQTRVTSLASDPDGNTVTYAWTADGGTISDPTGDHMFWTAPNEFGDFTVRLEVSDGTLTAVDSILVPVGQGSVYVTSDPPNAPVTIDGKATSFTTPHLFDPVARGPHGVRVTSPEWKYDRESVQITMGHGQADTVRFRTLPASFEILNLGRNDFEEIGGMTYLRNGAGVVYAARSTQLGVGIYSSALTPATGAPNAIKLTGDVALNEPLAIYGADSLLVYTNRNGALVAARIFNLNSDGVIDSIPSGRIWSETNAYGVTMRPPDLVAVSLLPSTSPAGAGIYHGITQEGNPPTLVQATNTNGRQPSWDPGGYRIAYQYQGQLLWAFADGTSFNSADTVATEGYCQLPTWGPYGPRHIAYAQGADELNAFEVRLQVATSQAWVSVFSGLFDVRDMAWSPQQRVLAVTHNPGSAQMVLLFNLPIP